jgi:hypothetical protein
MLIQSAYSAPNGSALTGQTVAADPSTAPIIYAETMAVHG